MLRQIFFAVVLLLISLRNPSALATPDQNDRIVVMISVDGLGAYYLDDPKAEMPNIRALATKGARAASMKASTPTVTWPNHTTLVTGVEHARHGVVGNNYYDRAKKQRVTLILDPVFDKDEIVKVPTIYDAAKSNGLRTAVFIWPASRNAHSLDWTVPESGSLKTFEKYSTPGLLKELEGNGISFSSTMFPNPDKRTVNIPSDTTSTRAFNYVLHKYKPQLALLHIADVDHTEHDRGPRSADAYASIKAADALIGDVWQQLEKDFPGKATLLVVSDHGFSPIENMILPNVILRKAGLIQVEGKKIVGGSVQTLSQGGSLFIYILDDKRRADIVKQIEKAFRNVKGVSRVVGPNQLEKLGVASPKNDPHAPDMMLFAEMGHNFGDTAAGELSFEEKPERLGSHGHDASLPDLHATFVAWGAGIKPGTRLGEISNLDVAPTIVKLLQIPFPSADGKPLSKILK